ncbi:hypothetical protein C0995_005697 [Termitomyces sp. Mi166|nr:hypothetical protein C0995_005697 [Termitomyces sp. Mi166\
MSVSKGASFKGTKPSEREGRHDPKFIGEIPGYPVGSRFANRADLSGAGVHAPLRSGIHGNQVDGAYSVVLSYGYEDDEDNGETFSIYTGQGKLFIFHFYPLFTYFSKGGRETDSSKLDILRGKESWSSHQATDQEWKLGNKALLVLALYALTREISSTHAVAWKDEGSTGFQTCKFRFERLPNQLPLPGGYASSPSAASSLKKPLQSSHVGQSSNSMKPPIASSSKALRPSRIPHVPRPPYRPSAADIAKLQSHSKSKSNLHSITPRHTSATPPLPQPQQPTPQPQPKGAHNSQPPYRPSTTDIAKLKGKSTSHSTSPDRCPGPAQDISRLNETRPSVKVKSVSQPEPEVYSSPSPSPEPEKVNRKRPRSVSEGYSEESEEWRMEKVFVEESDEWIADLTMQY